MVVRVWASLFSGTYVLFFSTAAKHRPFPGQNQRIKIKIHFWYLQVISLLLQENRDLIRQLSCLSMGSPQCQFMNKKQKLIYSKNSTKNIDFAALGKIQILLQLVTSCTTGVLTTKYLVPTNFLYTEAAMCWTLTVCYNQLP